MENQVQVRVCQVQVLSPEVSSPSPSPSPQVSSPSPKKRDSSPSPGLEYYISGKYLPTGVDSKKVFTSKLSKNAQC